MYFDPHVKEKNNDFFNFEVLREELKKSIEDKSTPIIAIHGLRRTGKTSIIRVVLNSMKKKYVWIDGRIISSKKSFFDQLIHETNKLRLVTFKAITIKGIEISWNYAQKGLDYLNKHKMVLVIDEAQLLKKMHVDDVVAFIYDNYPRIKVILSGSEAGMLMNFLGKNNAGAPLYGRAVLELQTHRLDKEGASRFLSQGAKQSKITISDSDIENATATLGGITGWLTKYGWFRLKIGHKEALRKTVQEGKLIVMKEFIKFSSLSEEKYRMIMKVINGGASWSDIKQNTDISDKQLYVMLKRLDAYGFIEKHDGLYTIADPLLAVAI